MIGRTVSHYCVIEQIGEGTSGHVYKADDLKLGRPVALKFLAPHLFANSSAVLRFQLEARMASALNHPNICAVYDIGQHDDAPFIVMELLEGQVLSQTIANGPMAPLKIDELLEIATQLTDALDSAHEQNVVHRDIKPANIFITRRGQAKILDFGLALLAARPDAPPPSWAGSFTRGGTYPYMSPEQLRGEELDARTDLFSLGAVLYEMATGWRAFSGHTLPEIREAILNHPLVKPAELNPALPEELNRIICKALEKNRKLRFQTAADFRADLQRLRRDMEAGSVKTLLPETGRAWRRMGRLRQAATVAALVAAVGVPVTIIEISRAQRSAVSATEVAPYGGVQPPPPASPAAAATVPAATPAREAVATPTTLVDRQAAQQELRIAQAKASAGLADQALTNLHDLVVTHANTPEALEAYFLTASIHESRNQSSDAMATYLEIADRYSADPRAPEALFRLATLIRRSSQNDKDERQRQALEKIVRNYKASQWAPRALLALAALQQSQHSTEQDTTLKTVVPSALVSYRRIATDYPQSPLAEGALQKLSSMYADLNRFDLAAKALTELGARFPKTNEDAWFRAAEMYRRRLHDAAHARAAYLKVPKGSSHYEEAQKQLGAARK